MSDFIALLRGINVGKAKRVPMAELRALLSELGYTDIATLLNSGNAVFRAAKGPSARHAKAIAAALSDRFGFEVPVIVKSAKELAEIVAGNPIEADAGEHARFLVAFVQDAKALSGLAAVAPLVAEPERYAVGECAAYLLCAGGILESKAGEALLAKGKGLVTTRNLATVLKLREMLDERKA